MLKVEQTATAGPLKVSVVGSRMFPVDEDERLLAVACGDSHNRTTAVAVWSPSAASGPAVTSVLHFASAHDCRRAPEGWSAIRCSGRIVDVDYFGGTVCILLDHKVIQTADVRTGAVLRQVNGCDRFGADYRMRAVRYCRNGRWILAAATSARGGSACLVLESATLRETGMRPRTLPSPASSIIAESADAVAIGTAEGELVRLAVPSLEVLQTVPLHNFIITGCCTLPANDRSPLRIVAVSSDSSVSVRSIGRPLDASARVFHALIAVLALVCWIAVSFFLFFQLDNWNRQTHPPRR